MPDEKTPEPTTDPRMPSQADARPLSDADVNRQVGEGKVPGITPGSAGTGRPPPDQDGSGPNIGAAHAPVSAEDIEPGGEKNLYDRLAEKDVTPEE